MCCYDCLNNATDIFYLSNLLGVADGSSLIITSAVIITYAVEHIH